MSMNTDVELALAGELAELRQLIDRRTAQCLDYRAALLESDATCRRLEIDVARLEDTVAVLTESYEAQLAEARAASSPATNCLCCQEWPASVCVRCSGD